jgi:hypothetical protein
METALDIPTRSGLSFWSSKLRLGGFCRGQSNRATVPGEGYVVAIFSGWIHSVGGF